MLEVRTATVEDLPTLTMAWHEAGFWRPEQRDTRPSIAAARQMPDVRRYLWSPDRDGDVAVVASVDGQGVGGAWARLFPADDPGYGFVDASTPELGIGVAPAWRGRGIGHALLSCLLVEAAAAGHTRVSLSVEWDNPSRFLYRQFGFREVATDTDGHAYTMLRRTRNRAQAP